MPRTHAFFAKGAQFLQAGSVAEWTLPNVAAAFTGVYPSKHKVCAKDASYDVARHDGPGVYFPSVFQSQGFLTSQYCSNWRKSPILGYAKGFDRTLYKRKDYPADQVISDMVEQLSTFEHRRHFMWATFFDLHHDVFGHPELMSQANFATLRDSVNASVEKSVFRSYSAERSNWYLAKVKRLDAMLGMLYAYLETNYDDDDFIVSLYSDHGVSFLSKETAKSRVKLSDARTKVLLLFRGHKVPAIKSEKKIQNMDLFPTVLGRLAQTDVTFRNLLQSYEGRLDALDAFSDRERTEIIAESIYPGQQYSIRIDRGSECFLFVSKEFVTQTGTTAALSLESPTGEWQVRRDGEWSSLSEEQVPTVVGALRDRHIGQLNHVPQKQPAAKVAKTVSIKKWLGASLRPKAGS